MKKDVVVVPSESAGEPALEIVRYMSFETELGRFLVAGSDDGLRSVSFDEDLDIARELSRLTRGGRAMAVEDRMRLRRFADDVRDYVSGTAVAFDYRLDLRGLTDFQRRVLEVVRAVPFGSLRSYKWVAREIGAPRATRPVGQALSRNPLPVVVPCHRVVNSDGTLGGYSSGGPDMKRRLIELENGQIGLGFRKSEQAGRESIRFILESEGGEE